MEGRLMEGIRGVVFDMDGTLLDTEKLYLRFWLEAAARMGYPMEGRHVLMIRGMAPSFAEPLLRREVCADFDYYGVRALRRELMDAYIGAHGVEPKPGMQETLKSLCGRGMRIALATATPPERALGYLRMVGAAEYFDAIVCASMVKRGKPAPDIYLEAVRRLGLAPCEAVAVEDAPSGIRSAHAAGLHPVMVPDQDEPDGEIRALCAAVVPELTGILKLF